jgi:hypothetical protein
MINVDKQIKYWVESSGDDLETAELLIESKKVLHGLFFCHLSCRKSYKSACS